MVSVERLKRKPHSRSQIYFRPVSRPEVKAATAAKKKSGYRFPWLLFLLLLATVYFFWIYPFQRGARPVIVKIEASPTTQ